MKKRWIYPLFLALAMGLPAACSDDENTNPGGPELPDAPVATVRQAQQEIDRVGKDFMNEIDTEELNSVYELVADCAGMLGIDEDDEPYYPGWGYGARAKASAGFAGLNKLFRAVATGDFSVAASSRAAEEIYRVSDYYGEWTWDERNEEWVKTADNASAAIYRFKHNGKACVAQAKGSGNKFTLRHDIDGERVTVEVPAEVTASLIEAGKTMVQIDVHTSKCSLDGKELALTTEVQVANLKAVGQVDVSNKLAKANVRLTAGGKELLNAACNVDGNNLADVDAYESEYFDPTQDLKAGTAACNIMGSMSLNLVADNKDGKLGAALDFDGYYWFSESFYEGLTTPVKYGEGDKNTAKREAVNAADMLNQKAKAALYFANSTYTVPVTFRAAETYHYNYEEHDSYNPAYYYKSEGGEWSVEPLMTFEDGTTYTFEGYFDNTRFGSLVTMFNDLVDKVTGDK